MKDMFGTKIEVGDYVTFASRYSSCCWMDIARVTGFDGKKILLLKKDRHDDEIKPSYTQVTDRLMVVTSSLPRDIKDKWQVE